MTTPEERLKWAKAARISRGGRKGGGTRAAESKAKGERIVMPRSESPRSLQGKGAGR